VDVESGNVREWCADWFHADFHVDGPRENPLGRVLRALAPDRLEVPRPLDRCWHHLQTPAHPIVVGAVCEHDGIHPVREEAVHLTKLPMIAAVALSGLALAGCGSSKKTASTPATTPAATTTQTTPEAVPAVVNASIGDNFYKPSSLTVKVGQTIKWKNTGAAVHTVTGKSGLTFDSGNLNPGAVYALKPGGVGKITYQCTIHGFTGTITVTR
jgi:plastocyanin